MDELRKPQCVHTTFLCSVSSLLSDYVLSNSRDTAPDTSLTSIANSVAPTSVHAAEELSGSFGSCRVCGKVSFVSRDDQKEHYKSQLHITNLKRSLMGLSSVSAVGDDDGVADMELKETSDSEDEDDQDGYEPDLLDDELQPVGASDWGIAGSGRGREAVAGVGTEQVRTLFPEGTVVKTYNNVTGATYRFVPNAYPACNIIVPTALFVAAQRTVAAAAAAAEAAGEVKQVRAESPWEQLSVLCSWDPRRPYVAVLLLQSGRFAGAVFDTRTCLSSAGKQTKMLDTISHSYFQGGRGSSVVIPQHPSNNYYSPANLTCVKHKAIRRYTVRAKAGGSQSSHDGQGKKAKSMGAQLRRYGEQKLKDDVYEVLREWGNEGLMERCAYILVSVGRTLQHVLFRDSPSGSSAGSAAAVSAQEEFPHKLGKADPRVVRSLGMMIDKPTLEECCRVFRSCTTVTFEKLPPAAQLQSAAVAEVANAQAVPAGVVVANAATVPLGVSVAVAVAATDDAFALGPDVESGDADAVAVAAEELSEEQPLLSRLLLKACACDSVDTMRMVINGLKLTHNRRFGGQNQPAPTADVRRPVGREERPEDDDAVDETVFDLDEEEDEDPAGGDDGLQSGSVAVGGPRSGSGPEVEIAALLAEVRGCVGDQAGESTEFTMQELLNLYISQCSLLDGEGAGVDVRHSLYYSTLNAPADFTDFKTPLHIACQRGCLKTVKLLLLSGVADPMKTDASGLTPYQYCRRKDCKMVFRRVRALYEGESAQVARQHGRCLWNWDCCGGVPPGLSAEAERAQKQKAKEKKKRAKAGKKERAQQEREQEEASAARDKEQKSLLEARQREEADRAGHCCICDVSLVNNKLVVNVFDQKCCSARCVMALRRRLAADAAEKRLAPAK